MPSELLQPSESSPSLPCRQRTVHLRAMATSSFNYTSWECGWDLTDSLNQG